MGSGSLEAAPVSVTFTSVAASTPSRRLEGSARSAYSCSRSVSGKGLHIGSEAPPQPLTVLCGFFAQPSPWWPHARHVGEKRVEVGGEGSLVRTRLRTVDPC